MSPRTLQISPDLVLPVDAATETFGILAKKGAGKSNAAVVMAEELWKAGVPWVCIDPKGDWWGLRSSADGKSAGLSLPVFGGRHGDLPLEATSGAFIADLVLGVGNEDRGYLTCVLDVSQFTISEQRRFLHAFGERLFRQKDEDGVLHLFLEEAHEYLPQSVDRGQQSLVSTWQRIVKQGRFKGLGCTLVSQRSAALNKDVLTQVDSLIVLRTLSPQDNKAVGGWVKSHSDATEILDSLPSLKDGEAWIWSPEFLGRTQRFRFRRRETFDSGATPKVGQAPRRPATLADIDIETIRVAMADTIERVKSEDPKELKKEIARLKKELGQRPTQPVIEVHEVVPSSVTTSVAEAHSMLLGVVETVTKATEMLYAIDRAIEGAEPAPTFPRIESDPNLMDHTPGTAFVPPSRSKTPKVPERAPVVDLMAALEASLNVAKEGRKASKPAGDGTLQKRERSILTVLAQYGPRTHGQLALQTGYSPRASTIGAGLSTLRKHGYVTRSQPVEITPAGLEALGEVEPLPQGPALLAFWRSQLGRRERLILDAMLGAHPEELTHERLCEMTGYSSEASTVGAGLSKLRKLGLVDGWRLAEDFMTAIS